MCLWQVDILPFISEKSVVRSKQDQQALSLLQASTVRVEVDGIQCYATPLLRRTPSVPLKMPKEAMLPSLRNTERKLLKDPSHADVYCHEIHKLQQAGYVSNTFQHQGQSLNELLLPGPPLGPSLLGVLLRFREHAVAVSGDIKGMFHQIHLLPADKPVLRFIWRDMQRDTEPDIYEWQVLPFGTTCSPCCAIYALQRHTQDNGSHNPGLVEAVERSVYVDNCLHSTSSEQEAKAILDGLHQLLLSGGFEVCQWASNVPAVIKHLPPEARSTRGKLWLSKSRTAVELHQGHHWIQTQIPRDR